LACAPQPLFVSLNNFGLSNEGPGPWADMGGAVGLFLEPETRTHRTRMEEKRREDQQDGIVILSVFLPPRVNTIFRLRQGVAVVLSQQAACARTRPTSFVVEISHTKDDREFRIPLASSRPAPQH
jgi:hypothetical protein